MKTEPSAMKDGESKLGLYLLAAVMFAVIYGLPVLAYFVGPHF